MQVLGNFIRNAIRRSERDGEVDVLLSFGSRVDGAVTFSVRDHGPRIPAQIQEAQFKPPTGVRDEQSALSGGLSYCARIVTLHGGTLGCESPLVEDSLGTTAGRGGGGSEFFFSVAFEVYEEEDD